MRIALQSSNGQRSKSLLAALQIELRDSEKRKNSHEVRSEEYGHGEGFLQDAMCGPEKGGHTEGSSHALAEEVILLNIELW
ncbi:hypothetical protein AVEN_270410-1 [Araneus ventricosus]|uniref:Uncharacterized protein n=1 Tax=Araneus ventricosus TaxID=182803 RepID=A0A4Y2T2L0_ARAVE|nr:hypothetical protein AVEN_270410-1 [Araneus ventricosus]